MTDPAIKNKPVDQASASGEIQSSIPSPVEVCAKFFENLENAIGFVNTSLTSQNAPLSIKSRVCSNAFKEAQDLYQTFLSTVLESQDAFLRASTLEKRRETLEHIDSAIDKLAENILQNSENISLKIEEATGNQIGERIRAELATLTQTARNFKRDLNLVHCNEILFTGLCEEVRSIKDPPSNWNEFTRAVGELSPSAENKRSVMIETLSNWLDLADAHDHAPAREEAQRYYRDVFDRKRDDVQVFFATKYLNRVYEVQLEVQKIATDVKEKEWPLISERNEALRDVQRRIDTARSEANGMADQAPALRDVIEKVWLGKAEAMQEIVSALDSAPIAPSDPIKFSNWADLNFRSIYDRLQAEGLEQDDLRRFRECIGNITRELQLMGVAENVSAVAGHTQTLDEMGNSLRVIYATVARAHVILSSFTDNKGTINAREIMQDSDAFCNGLVNSADAAVQIAREAEVARDAEAAKVTAIARESEAAREQVEPEAQKIGGTLSTTSASERFLDTLNDERRAVVVNRDAQFNEMIVVTGSGAEITVTLNTSNNKGTSISITMDASDQDIEDLYGAFLKGVNGRRLEELVNSVSFASSSLGHAILEKADKIQSVTFNNMKLKDECLNALRNVRVEMENVELTNLEILGATNLTLRGVVVVKGANFRFSNLHLDCDKSSDLSDPNNKFGFVLSGKLGSACLGGDLTVCDFSRLQIDSLDNVDVSLLASVSDAGVLAGIRNWRRGYSHDRDTAIAKQLGTALVAFYPGQPKLSDKLNVLKGHSRNVEPTKSLGDRRIIWDRLREYLIALDFSENTEPIGDGKIMFSRPGIDSNVLVISRLADPSLCDVKIYPDESRHVDSSFDVGRHKLVDVMNSLRFWGDGRDELAKSIRRSSVDNIFVPGRNVSAVLETTVVRSV